MGDVILNPDVCDCPMISYKKHQEAAISFKNYTIFSEQMRINNHLKKFDESKHTKIWSTEQYKNYE